MAPQTHAVGSHHSAVATATARLHATATASASSAAAALCPPFIAAGSHSYAACPPVQNPIFGGPAAPWVVQPQRPAAALGPEFRRALSTKNISKRNRGAGAQDRCVRASRRQAAPRGTQRPPRARRGPVVIPGELVAPDDYCHVLRQLGDRDKSVLRSFEVFHAALSLVGNGAVDKGKLLTAAIGALGKMGRPDLARRAFDAGIAGGLWQHGVCTLCTHLSICEEWSCN